MNRIIQIFIFLILLCFIGIVSNTIAEENSTKEILISNWLKVGPLKVNTPVIPESSTEKFKICDVLSFSYFDISKIWPAEGDQFRWDNEEYLKWKDVEISNDSSLHLDNQSEKNHEIQYLVNYLETKSFFTGKIKISSYHLFEVYIDEKKICSKMKSDRDVAKNINPVSAEIKLEPGKHLMLIKLLFDKESKLEWNVKAVVESSDENSSNNVVSTVNSERRLTLEHLLDIPEITNVSISADGKLTAVSYQQIKEDGKGYNYWLEIREAASGKKIMPYKAGLKISNLQWVSKNNQFSYTTTEKEKSKLWLVDLNRGATFLLLDNIKNLSYYSWAPDASFIIYSITEKPEEDKNGLKKMQGMPDHWPGWRDRTDLYILYTNSKTTSRLTSGKISTSLYDIHPKSDRILISQSRQDYSIRSFFKESLFILDLKTMVLDSIWSGQWLNSAKWSPDGNKLLLTGGPSLFGDLGKATPEGSFPNEYDTQAYLFDPDTRKVKPISLNFFPSIKKAVWSHDGKIIYFATTDHSSEPLYRFELKSEKYNKITTGQEVIKDITFAENAPYAVYYGSSASKSHTVNFINLKNNEYKILFDPSIKYFRHTKLGKIDRWTFKNKRDAEIEGRIYYPPNFNADKKYPCIVYYYGGTSPVTRGFGGRYPKNFYAAHDYIIYVLQPSGCVGFGQEFSSLHVNDWGKIVADEIIDGVGQFLDAHTFVDRDRVGCLGASYGGFMTMLLTTKTNIFKAAISHAGISAISSYWGEGYWGYLYNARSAANSYPWNRKDIYVDQSPLYNADKINTPLLLLHGNSDTNVPPGESRQLYAALKILGKETELIEVDGQNHWIMEYSKRKKWTKTIIAWFDKWLKEDDSWWKELYSK